MCCKKWHRPRGTAAFSGKLDVGNLPPAALQLPCPRLREFTFHYNHIQNPHNPRLTTCLYSLESPKFTESSTFDKSALSLIKKRVIPTAAYFESKLSLSTFARSSLEREAAYFNAKYNQYMSQNAVILVIMAQRRIVCCRTYLSNNLMQQAIPVSTTRIHYRFISSTPLVLYPSSTNSNSASSTTSLS